MSGVPPDRLSAEAVLALSGVVGNSALLEMISRQQPLSLRETCPMPPPLPVMEGAILEAGSPDLMAPVDFAALPPLETAPGPAYGGVL